MSFSEIQPRKVAPFFLAPDMEFFLCPKSEKYGERTQLRKFVI